MLRFGRIRAGLVAAAVAVGLTTGAHATIVTGDPAADGWHRNGNSLDLGTFVRTTAPTTAKLFDFDVYSTSFTLDASSNLNNGSTWLTGDLIVGVGATVNPTDALTPAVRVLAKFGTSTATFAPSTTLPNPPSGKGDGIGSSSASGVGGVILETPHTWSGSRFTPANEGLVVTFRDGKPESPYGRLIYQLDDNDLLSRFEGFLNISLLERDGFSVNPAPGDRFILSLQNNSAEYTDGFGTTTAAGTPVPEPSSIALIVLGSAGFGLVYRRRLKR